MKYLPVNQIVCGSALDVLKQWPSESVDCCVTIFFLTSKSLCVRLK